MRPWLFHSARQVAGFLFLIAEAVYRSIAAKKCSPRRELRWRAEHRWCLTEAYCDGMLGVDCASQR
jgi:hypothetical protein